ncbi:hypothetical protein [Paenibacillus sp. FSL K6-2524]
MDWFIPHSANMRLIEPLCEKLEFLKLFKY